MQTAKFTERNNYIMKSMVCGVNVIVCQLHSGHLPGMSVGGDPGQTTLPPLCLHWQYQVYSSGMVCSCFSCEK